MATKKTTTKKAASKKATTKSAPKEAKVFNGYIFVRSYNKKDHGDDYQKLAEQFAAKNGFTMRLK